MDDRSEASPMIKAVISDLGKVILFFDNRIFFRKIATYSPSSEEEIASLVRAHFNLIESFDTGKITPEEFYRAVVTYLKTHIAIDEFFTIYNDVFSLNPRALHTLKRLKPKYKLLLLSNTDISRFGFIKGKFPEILIFDEYVLSFEVGFMKPHPQIYREAVARAQAEPGECVFIDDIEENIQAAKTLGIKAILFGPDTDLEKALKAQGIVF